MKPKTIFFSIAEPGVLEKKAVLVLESFRKFAGSFRDSEYWIFRARQGDPLAPETLRRLKELGAHYHEEPLNTQWPYYALANKVAVAAFLEEQCSDRCDFLVFADSDMLFLNEPKELILEEHQQCAIAPVSHKGRGQSPVSNPPENAELWKDIYEACGVRAENVWEVRPRHDDADIKAYFNSGLISVRPRRGLFAKWKKAFGMLMEKYRHEIEGHYMLEQTCFTGVLLSELTKNQIKSLDLTYNYSLPYFMKDRRVKAVDDLTVVHYHHFFQNGFPMKFLVISPELLQWLKPRVKKLRTGKSEEYFSVDKDP